jgi:hypothetical protein
VEEQGYRRHHLHEVVSFDAYAPASKIAGSFEDPSLKAVVVTDGDEYEGVITQKQLGTFHPARNALKGEVLKGKTYGRTKKYPDEEYWSRLYGSCLTSE